MFRLLQIVLVFLAMIVPAWAQPVTISGTVTYRERIALPSGAQLRVTLVTLPEGQSLAGATARIPAKGQVPLSYSLNVHRPLGNGIYGLVAEIQAGDAVLFRNAAPAPVDPTSSEPVEIVVQSQPRQLARPPAPTFPAALIDTEWTVTSIGGRPTLNGRPVTLLIAADLRAGGKSGCNDYFSEASISEGAITFGPAAATRMACAPDVMAQEAGFFAALEAVAEFDLDGTRLRLLDAAGIPLIGLVREGE
ncbi:META domain-containing protein [Devosia chinhatensis]|uniref:DUF306 domain-containing protein n=1 Tax=Devosia chinhatensis TaxID=429727 RepID=A0A0F5FEQ2_9HYPH|nr:META domain-containing protein [Devosia chinhatensis]KKB07278.1 hypothetical protein VE26_10770 [Devosia chinhatensis]